jgi:hypothetical protein
LISFMGLAGAFAPALLLLLSVWFLPPTEWNGQEPGTGHLKPRTQHGAGYGVAKGSEGTLSRYDRFRNGKGRSCGPVCRHTRLSVPRHHLLLLCLWRHHHLLWVRRHHHLLLLLLLMVLRLILLVLVLGRWGRRAYHLLEREGAGRLLLLLRHGRLGPSHQL